MAARATHRTGAPVIPESASIRARRPRNPPARARRPPHGCGFPRRILRPAPRARTASRRRPSPSGRHGHGDRAGERVRRRRHGAASTSACRPRAGSPSRREEPRERSRCASSTRPGRIVESVGFRLEAHDRHRRRGRPHEGAAAARPQDARAAERQRHPDRRRRPRVAGELLRLLRALDSRPRPHPQGHEVLRAPRRELPRLLPRDAARGRDDLGLLQPRPGAQLLRDGLRPARLRAPLRRRRDGPHAGRGGRRVPLRRGRLLRLEVHRRRRLDGPPARRGRPRAGLLLHRSRPLLDEVRPREARLHDRHLGLPDRRRDDPRLPAMGNAPRRPRPLEVRRDVRRQHRLRGLLRLPGRDAGARGAGRGGRALPPAREGRARAARPGGLAGHALPPLGARGRDGGPRRGSGREGAGVALEHLLAQPRDHAGAGRGDPAHLPGDARLAAPRLPRRVVRDLPALRQGLQRPRRAVAVRERRRVADHRRRAGARGVRPRLRELRRFRPLARPRPLEVERRPDLVRLHRSVPAGPAASLHARRSLEAGEHGPRRERRPRRAGLDGGDARRPPRQPADGPPGSRGRAVPRGGSRHERPPRRDRRVPSPRVPRARPRAGRCEGGLDLRPPQRRQRGEPEGRGRDHLRLRGRHRGDAVRRPGPERVRLVVPVARGLVAGRLRRAAAPAAREARLAGQKRHLPERRHLLVRPRQPAPGPDGPRHRLHRAARRCRSTRWRA